MTCEPSIVHLLSGLAYGGKEQVAIDLARTGIARGQRHLLLLYDTPYRTSGLDLDPLGVPCEYLPRRDRGLDWTLAPKILSVLRRERAAILHAHAATALVYAAIAKTITWPSTVGVLATFHVQSSPPSPGGRLAVRVAARAADKLVAVSQALARDLRAQGLPTRIETILNGTDLALFNPAPVSNRRAIRRKLGLPEDAFILGTLGRLDPVKRQEDLLAAATRLPDGSVPFHLVVGGDGPLRAILAAQAALIGNVTIAGAISNRTDFYAALDAFALCSQHEAGPLVLLEAMACGLPVIATAVGGIPEMVVPSGDYLRQLVPVGDIDALARAICNVVSASSRSPHAPMENRDYAERFSLATMYESYASLYRTLALAAGVGSAAGSAGAS